MKRILLGLLIFICGYSYSQITYTLTPVGGSYTYNSSPTVIHAASVDDAISPQITIFNFCYGGLVYNKLQVSSNGVMFLGTSAAGANLTNNLQSSTDRPAIAPLWDDLKTGTGGNVNYQVAGSAPNRILTIEWKQMLWTYSGTTWAISFQAKLYETTNVIEFVYDRNGNATANIVSGSASIGLSGPTSGDFYSLADVTAAPAVSKITETTTLASKPATGQIYRWTPDVCSGAPAAGTAVATPSYGCANYTTTLTLQGGSTACGVTYTWQSSSTSAAGPWTTFGTSSTTQTFAVTAPRWFRVISGCGVSTSTSAVGTATFMSATTCGLCGVQPITLPYTASLQTTCGYGNDLTAAMVTNGCSSTSYLGGEDVIYTFTPSTSGQISVTYSTSGSSAAAMLYQGCPNSGGSCVGNVNGVSSFSGNQTICANVTAGQPYFLVIDSWPSPTCNGYNISVSSVTTSSATCTLSNYSAASTTYSFDTFVGTLTPSTDDVLYNSVALFGFTFCYAGNSYTGGYISSNGSFVFDAVPCFPNIYISQYAAPGISTGWANSAAAPSQVNTTSLPQNAVNAPWQDINPSLGGVIRYATLGTAPNRRFVVSYENVPMFSCGTSSPSIYFTGQIKLFETSNNIEMHINNKGICPGWNSGTAIMGLTSYDGLTYIPPVNMTAHNYPTNWTMTNTAYKFSAPCATLTSVCAILPIQFKTFYGEQKNNVNHLYWQSGEEQNLKTFIVERSSDAENFTEIARVTPNNRPSKYTYDDVTFIPNTINYYRITSLENDGTRSGTNIVILGASIGEVAVSGIYPNPVQSDFVLSVDARKGSELQIKIYDLVGKQVKSFTRSSAIGIQQMNFNVSELPAGSYMVEVRSSDTQVITQQKLIKVD
jgi:hypothetical protein